MLPSQVLVVYIADAIFCSFFDGLLPNKIICLAKTTGSIQLCFLYGVLFNFLFSSFFILASAIFSFLISIFFRRSSSFFFFISLSSATFLPVTLIDMQSTGSQSSSTLKALLYFLIVSSDSSGKYKLMCYLYKSIAFSLSPNAA